MLVYNVYLPLIFPDFHNRRNNGDGSSDGGSSGDGNPGGGSRLMISVITLAITAVTFAVVATVTQGAEQYS